MSDTFDNFEEIPIMYVLKLDWPKKFHNVELLSIGAGYANFALIEI
jgi:hypothetical protein